MADEAACVEPPTAPYSWRPGSCTPTVPMGREEKQYSSILHREAVPPRLRVLHGCLPGQEWTRKATSMGVDECGLRAPTLGPLFSHTEPC